MANPKRYFPVSHDLIHDPEMQMMVRSFGAEVYPIWLWMLSGLDRTENKFVIHESAFRELKRVVHKSPQIIEKTVRKLVDIGWISGRKVGDKWEFASPNYRHYHRTRAPNRPPPTYLPSDSSPNPQKDSSKNLPIGPSLRNGHEGERHRPAHPGAGARDDRDLALRSHDEIPPIDDFYSRHSGASEARARNPRLGER